MPCHRCAAVGHVVETYRHGELRVMFCLGCEQAWTLLGDGLILKVLSR